MEGGQNIRCVLCEFQGALGQLKIYGSHLSRTVGESCAELRNHLWREVSLVLPQINQAFELCLMLGAVVESRRIANHGGQDTGPCLSKLAVGLAHNLVVEHIIGNVEEMQPASLGAAALPVILHG